MRTVQSWSYLAAGIRASKSLQLISQHLKQFQVLDDPVPHQRQEAEELTKAVQLAGTKVMTAKAFLTIQQTRAFQRLHGVENLTNKHSKVMGFN